MRKLKAMAMLMSAICCVSFAGATNVTALESPVSGVYDEYKNGIYNTMGFDWSAEGKGSFRCKKTDGGTGIIINRCLSNIKSVTIPDEINGTPVISIQQDAFNLLDKVEEINIPDNIELGPKSLHGCAWYDAQPDGPVYIGNVFYNYKGTIPPNTTVKIKEGTKSIAWGAFTTFQLDTDLTVPLDDPNRKPLEELIKAPFKHQDGLVRVEIPDSVQEIGDYAFQGCTNLQEIVFPSGKAVKVGVSAFNETAWYNSQPDGLVYIGDVLYECKGGLSEKTDLVLDEKTKSIATWAFKDCQNLQSIVFPSNLEIIGICAFYKCTSLTSIEIPDSVKQCLDSAFSGCSSLTSVKLPNGIEKISSSLFYGCKSLKEFQIPDSVKLIDYCAFCGTGLTEIVIPKNVKSIGSIAFYIPTLQNITIEADDCYIGYDSYTIANDSYYDLVGNLRGNYNGTITDCKGSIAEVYAEKFGYKFICNSEVSKIKNASLYYAEPGDLNGNGMLDIIDPVRIAKYLIGKDDFDDVTKQVADYNKDGKVDIIDAVGIAQALLKK